MKKTHKTQGSVLTDVSPQPCPPAPSLPTPTLETGENSLWCRVELSYIYY